MDLGLFIEAADGPADRGMSALQQPGGDYPYRMQDLVQATGASRETIRFYVKEGLLPEPHRTAKNSAWYGEQHIEQIRLIRELQEQHYLPLKAIKSLMDDPSSAEFTPAQRRVFATVSRRSVMADSKRGRSFAEVCRRHQLSAAEQQSFLDSGLLSVGKDGKRDAPLSTEDEELIRIWVTVRAAGLTPERGFAPADVSLIGDAADILLSQMVHSFADRLDDFSEAEAEGLWITILPAVERLFSILLERRVRGFVGSVSNSTGKTS